MSLVHTINKDGVSYYNYGNETCWTVGTSCQAVESRPEDSVIYHEKSDKPFAYLRLCDRRWYKVKDTTGPRDTRPTMHERPTTYQPDINRTRRLGYNITNENVDFNINIKFYYTNELEQFVEIPQDSVHICTQMKDEKIKNKLLYFTETKVENPSRCSLQGGKTKHKPYRRKRQQRRSKRRQSKRIQRKSK